MGLGLYEIFKSPPPALKGDMARVGDNVRVSIATLPPNSLPVVLPQGVGLIDVKVTSLDQDPTFVDGQVTGYYLQENLAPVPIQPGNLLVRIPRSSIVTVMRGGQAIA